MASWFLKHTFVITAGQAIQAKQQFALPVGNHYPPYTQFNDRLVAIKELSRDRLTNQEIRSATEAFKSEAQLLAGLTHPNLPRIYDQFNEQGRCYLVMDFIDGETLSEYLVRKQVSYLPVSEVLEIGIQLSTVLSYLHTRQLSIIFRDLKPDNIMRAPDGQVYLIDFGIARHFKLGQIKDTIALGSPGYAAPEQYGRTQTTPAADIYGLGATLHSLISGEDPSMNPFRFAPLCECSQEVPAELDVLIMKMLDMDVRMRPSDSEVRQEIKRIAASWSATKNTSTLSTKQAHRLQQNTSLATSSRQIAQFQSSSLQPKKTRSTSRKKAGLIAAILILGFSFGIFSVFSLNLHNNNGGHVLTRSATSLPIIHPLYTLPGISAIQFGSNTSYGTIAWSPDGKYLAGADAETIYIWSSAGVSNHPTFSLSHKNIQKACQHGITSFRLLTWSPDSSSVAFDCMGFAVSIWNIYTDQIVLTFQVGSMGVNQIAWSPDGKYLTTASNDWSVKLWDVKTGQKHFAYYAHEEPVATVAWSPDGKYIASGGYDQNVKIWNPTNGQTLLTYNVHRNWITAISWSPDSSTVASADADGFVHVWNAKNGKDFTGQNAGARVMGLVWSPDGKSLAIGTENINYSGPGSTGVLQLWNTTNWSHNSYTLWTVDSYVVGDDLSNLTWSPDTQKLAYSSGQDIQVLAA